MKHNRVEEADLHYNMKILVGFLPSETIKNGMYVCMHFFLDSLNFPQGHIGNRKVFTPQCLIY